MISRAGEGATELEHGDLMVRSIGGKTNALAKLFNGDDSVGSQQIGMVHVHLGEVCTGSLGVRNPEVGEHHYPGGQVVPLNSECSILQRPRGDDHSLASGVST